MRYFSNSMLAPRLLKQTIVAVLVLLGTSVCWLWSQEEGTGKGGCVSCHEATLERAMYSYHPHQPFLERKCEACHSPGGLEKTGVLTDGPAYAVKNTGQKQKGTRILRNTEKTGEHWIWARGLFSKSRYRFRILLRDAGTGDPWKSPWQEVVPAELGELQDDGQPPTISDIQVSPIRQSPLPGVLVEWVTDKPSDSCVEYGSKRSYGVFSPLNNYLTRKHKIALFGLDRSRTYHYRVISRDAHGNIGRSGDRTMDFGDLEPGKSPVPSPEGREQAVVAADSIALYRFGQGDVLFTWRSKPACFGWIEFEEIEKWTIGAGDLGDPAEEKTGEELQEEHPLMNSREQAAIDACYGCHEESHLGTSHPVRIYMKGKTRIPADLPTVKGGMMTCVTCHHPHGGKEEFLVRKKIVSRICVSCHYTKEDVLR